MLGLSCVDSLSCLWVKMYSRGISKEEENE